MIAGLLPILQPEVAGDPGVVLVGCPQPPAPAVELARGDPQPSRASRQTGRPVRVGPVADEVDDRIAGGLGNPGSVQSSPSSFFSLICSSMSSERTSFLRWSFCSRRAILPVLGVAGASGAGLEGGGGRSRRTPSASGRTSWGGCRAGHTGPRPGCVRGDGAAGWRPSPGR